MAKRTNYQSFEPCVACGEKSLQRCYHHVTTRKAGGSDEPSNMMSLCFKCHTEIHQIGPGKMCQKYDDIKIWLVKWDRWDVLAKI